VQVVADDGRTRGRSVRVPDDLWEAARAIADSRGETVSGVMVASLRRYVRSNGWDVDPLHALDHLARLRASGAVTDDEYRSKKRELLDRI
jgi:predicted transcriptional regulator